MSTIAQKANGALAKLEAAGKQFLGPADIDEREPEPKPTTNRLEGSGGEYDVRRDNKGNSYLVSH